MAKFIQNQQTKSRSINSVLILNFIHQTFNLSKIFLYHFLSKKDTRKICVYILANAKFAEHVFRSNHYPLLVGVLIRTKQTSIIDTLFLYNSNSLASLIFFILMIVLSLVLVLLVALLCLKVSTKSSEDWLCLLLLSSFDRSNLLPKSKSRSDLFDWLSIKIPQIKQI